MALRIFSAISHLSAASSLGAVVVLIGTVSVASAQGDNTRGGTVIGLWEPSAPPENPVTEEKRVLGKVLFWDEQLSSDNTVSCGTCHIPSAGGVDPRIGVNPAYDGFFGTQDDVVGSPGVIATGTDGMYIRSALYDLEAQVTGRRSMSNLVSMYPGNLFWDGRAEGDFIDPESGQVVSVSLSALEIQSLVPIMSNVEMAHQGRDWASVTAKIANATPLALASDIPQDMLDAIRANPTYPELFKTAFGDPDVTAVRIAFAIATYQRTLVPDRSPWDLWNAGDVNAMTPQQRRGWNIFRTSRCNSCHVAPLFTTNAFTTIGVRPPFEDLGRAVFSGSKFDNGAFRMSTLRNVGLRDRFMHTGSMPTMDDVFDFYSHRNGQQPFPQNLDFRIVDPILFSPNEEMLVKNFITTALTDPRVASETFPFDHPTLHTQLDIPNPLVIDAGNAGSGGFVPRIIAVTPPNIGNADFKIGLDYALGGAQAWVAISANKPTNGAVAHDELIGPINLAGMSPGDGYSTLIYPIDDTAMDNQTFYMQWIVGDPNAIDGFARSDIAQVTPFCSMIGACAPACPADLTGDGVLNFFDVSAFLNAFAANDPAADFDGNGNFNFVDVSAFLVSFGASCP